uniref:DUF2225 domain-containing protein n=1 Tax=Acetatifactor sp. TaxID=1872090 RepID=UPI0040578C0B
MAGLLSGLKGLGLGNLENMNIFEEPKAEEVKKPVESKPVVMKPEEKDFIYDKTFDCPVCYGNFSSKIMKTGKAKLIGTDWDLRPNYEGIDAVKYDVQLCTHCGYAALTRYFGNITSGQAKLIKENISQKVHLQAFDGETYTYEEAMERYKLTLANAVVKRAKTSEKAYICLKTAWLIRGYVEYLEDNGDTSQDKKALKAEEEEYLLNAYNGFVEARQTETFPMCGMDESAIEYLVAELAYHFKKYDIASKLVAAILTSPAANNRMKDKARELKDQILADLKNRG